MQVSQDKRSHTIRIGSRSVTATEPKLFSGQFLNLFLRLAISLAFSLISLS